VAARVSLARGWGNRNEASGKRQAAAERMLDQSSLSTSAMDLFAFR